MTELRLNWRLIALAGVLLAGFGIARLTHHPAAFVLLPFLAAPVVPRRGASREVEQQVAFEEAERLRAEQRANVVFESFIDSSPVGIEVFSLDGAPLRSNKAAERLLGKVPPPGIPLNDERGLKRAGLLEPQLRRVLAGTRVETPPTWYDPTEIGLPGIPGRKVCFRATVFPLFDSEGKIVRIAVMHEDLTEMKRAEQAARETEEKMRASLVAEPAPDAPVAGDARDIEFQRRKVEVALRESEERFRALFESARGYVVARFTEEGKLVAISPTVEEYLGVGRDTLMLDAGAFFAQVHPDDIDRVKAVESQVRKDGQYPAGHRFRVTSKTTGVTRTLEMRGGVVAAGGRRVVDILLVDASDARATEDALRDREAAFGVLTASPGDGVFTIDKDWVVTSWSPGAEKETRVATAEAVGKRLWDIYPDLERSGFATPFRKAMLDRRPQFHDGFYQDGREKYAGWFSVSVYPQGTGALAVIRNTSARRRAEVAWQEADAKLKALFEQPAVLITMKDRNLRYVLANPAAQKALAPSAEPMVGKTDPELFNVKVSALLASSDRQVLDKGAATELELALPDSGSANARWFHIAKQPWRGPTGEVVGVLDISVDVTPRVRAQQELARRREYVEKLLGEQTAGLRKAQEELSRWSK